MSPAWARWAEGVQKRPWAAIAVSLVILLGLAIPALHMRLGTSDAGLDPPGTTTREAYDIIAEGFGAGTSGSFLLAADLQRKGDTAAAQRVADAVSRDPDVAQVTPPQLSKDGEIATIVMFPKSGPREEETTRLLERLRGEILPPVEREAGAEVFVGGQVASQEDFTSVIADKLPLFVGMVVLLSALLLMAVFRSVFIPIKAAIMNLLSIGAALGFLTLVFQDGFMADALGVGSGPIESFVPVMTFAIVFGLSMDYEMFLMSRVREEWLRTGDASLAVRNGVATTGRVITAAALIMIVVFTAFALTPERVIKEFGLGLAMAVLLDALVIRCLLVPALMQVVGREGLVGAVVAGAQDAAPGDRARVARARRRGSRSPAATVNPRGRSVVDADVAEEELAGIGQDVGQPEERQVDLDVEVVALHLVVADLRVGREVHVGEQEEVVAGVAQRQAAVVAGPHDRRRVRRVVAHEHVVDPDAVVVALEPQLQQPVLQRIAVLVLVRRVAGAELQALLLEAQVVDLDPVGRGAVQARRRRPSRAG